MMPCVISMPASRLTIYFYLLLVPTLQHRLHYLNNLLHRKVSTFPQKYAKKICCLTHILTYLPNPQPFNIFN